MITYDTKKFNSWNKSNIKPKDIPKEKFIEVCKQNSTMTQACAELGLHFTTFKKYAQIYGCYETNQPGKGISKKITPRVWNLEKWNADENIVAMRSVIKYWILRLNLIPYKCNECGLSEWNNKKIVLELNHINGDSWDHRKSNLEFLCPNCHSQTHTFRGKKK